MTEIKESEWYERLADIVEWWQQAGARVWSGGTLQQADAYLCIVFRKSGGKPNASPEAEVWSAITAGGLVIPEYIDGLRARVGAEEAAGTLFNTPQGRVQFLRNVAAELKGVA